MRITRIVTILVVSLGLAYAGSVSQDVAVSPQYDTTHVYVAPEDFDRFVASLIATFGGTASKQGVFTVTPTPSSTMSQLVLTPVGTLSVFGFKTPIPYPFGAERTGYLVTDLDGATRAARAAGADVLVSPFDDPIGRVASTFRPTEPPRSCVASSPTRAVRRSPTIPTRPATRSGGRRTRTGGFESNRSSAS